MSRERASSNGPSVAGARFRRDIQGLRAVAVGTVVVNHLFGDALPGGFVGVDVFLVVSGFLITSLMLREVERTGRISLRDFYARRARRILPAATVVLVLTLLASVAVLALLRTRTVVTDAVWSTLFLGNVRMASVGSDYFADDAPVSPFRHYWSLAVEEQFYLVWPVVLVACAAWAGVRLRRRASLLPEGPGAGRAPAERARDVRVLAVRVLVVLTAASLAWSVWATSTSPTTAYYSTFTRAWELGLGALLAFVPATLPLTRRARELLSGGGLLMIAAAALFYDAETAFPGAAALLPVLGAVAVLLAGARVQDAGGSRLLGWRPLTVVGDWSYSLYLIHWPVIVLISAELEDDFTPGPKLAALVLVVVLSWASFRWVETPFRQARPFRSTRGGLLVYPVSVAVAGAVALASLQVVDHRLANPSGEEPVSLADQPAVAAQASGQDDLASLVEASVLEAGEGRGITGDLTPSLVDLESSVADLGDCDYLTGTRELCPMGDPDSDRDVVVLGDSLARAMSPAVVRIGVRHGLRVHVLGYAGCPATTLEQPAKGTSKRWKECEEFKEWALDTVERLDPELVVVATSASSVLHPTTGKVVRESDSSFNRLAARGWRGLFAELGRRAEKVAVFANTPRLPEKPGDCLTDGTPELADCTYPNAERAATQAKVLMRAAEAEGAQVVDAAKWFCAEGRCPMVVGRWITLRDTHHVTAQYAQALATPLARELGLATPSPAAKSSPAVAGG